MRWLTDFCYFRLKWTATAAIRIHPTKAWLSQLVNFKMQSGREEKRYTTKLCFKLWKNTTEIYGMLHTVFGASCRNWASVLSGIRDSRKVGSLGGMIRGVRGIGKPIHQSWLAKGLGLGLLCWGFKGVQEEILTEEASTHQMGSVTFPAGQCTSPTTPSLSQTFWPRWASRQFLSFFIVQTLVPVAFAYSLRSEVVVMRQLRRWKRLWRRSLTPSQKRTSREPSRSCWNSRTSALQPEENTLKGTRVSCVYYQ